MGGWVVRAMGRAGKESRPTCFLSLPPPPPSLHPFTTYSRNPQPLKNSKLATMEFMSSASSMETAIHQSMQPWREWNRKLSCDLEALYVVQQQGLFPWTHSPVHSPTHSRMDSFEERKH